MSDSMDAVAWGKPSWTAAMYPRKTGMDHLGLASVSQDRILPELSPGVNVLTVHPRYWSVYTWLLNEFWERDLPRTALAWGRFIKPRERMFVAAVLSCPEHGTNLPQVAGKARIGSEIADGPESCDPLAPYLKNPQGGYPIYASAISQLGLTVLARDVPNATCDVPTPYGREIGFALREWVRSTTYFSNFFEEPGEPVPAAALREYAERICLCRASEGPDYPYLQHAFMHLGHADDPERRRASLRLVCDLAEQTEPDVVGAWDFRLLTYFRQDRSGRLYEPSSEGLTETARRWRIYQHREFVAWGLNRWLRFITRWGLSNDGDRRAIPLQGVLATVEVADFAALASEIGAPDPGLGPSSPIQALLDWVVQTGRVDTDLDAAWDVTALTSEDNLMDVAWQLDRDDGAALAAVVSLLAVCASRLWPREHQLRYAADWHLIRHGGRRRLSVELFLKDFRTRVEQDATIAETMRWFLEHYVIRQHHRTALAKLPDDTFRLRLDAGRVHFVDEPVAVELNDSRFFALSTCAAELDLITSLDAEDHELTDLGRLLRDAGDLPVPDGVSVPE